jgi:aldehyde oxidoreductase
MNLNINGVDRTITSPPATRLSDVLRDECGLTGTKVGCNAGDCGACTVLIEGESACACLVAVGQLEGAHVTTVEGLANSGTVSRLQRAFHHHGAAQCGICTPGMLMAAADLLNKTRAPSRQNIEDALGGVLCRCTGYAKIIDAVLSLQNPQQPDFSQHTLGSSLPRLDGAAKIKGSESFGADRVPDNALHCMVIRSPHDRAKFTLGDIDEWIRSNAGIAAVYSAKDIPGVNRFGVIPGFIDQPVFAEDEARFKGDAIAAVVGELQSIRTLNISGFPVIWEPLLAATTPDQALTAEAHFVQHGRPRNTLVEGHVERGDTTAGFAAATRTVEERFTTPHIEHAYIEPEAGYAERIGDTLVIYGCTQAPHMDRDGIADIMGLAKDQVRVIPSACGGGFGSKLDLSFQPFIALAAWTLKQPVAIVYARRESMQSTTKRHPSDISIRVGCDSNGLLTATSFHGTFNTGAFASWGPTVANRVPVHASGPYLTPNYLAKSKAVLTNAVPAGAFRGFGVPQSMFALECALDLLAERIGMDALEFRLINALRNGDPTATGQVFRSGVGIVDCLEALQPAWIRARRDAAAFNTHQRRQRRGVGLATCWYGCGNTSLPNPSTIRIGITKEGKLKLHQGAVDIGQGSNTVIAQIAAEALGLEVDIFELVNADTFLTPDAGKTSASRQTFVSGNAAKKSATALRAKICQIANVPDTAKIALGNGKLSANSNCIDLASLPANNHGYVLMAEETYDPPTKPLDGKGQGEPYAQYGYGAQVAELTVDIDLGTVKLNRITAAHDVGKAINPKLVEGQIEGGIAQGIGMALMEEYIAGRTDNLHDYLIPTIGDMPKIESIIVEVEDAHGPFGAKGLGEHVLIPTAPAIINAIRNATGALVRNLPATPDKVRAAIRDLERQ